MAAERERKGLRALRWTAVAVAFGAAAAVVTGLGAPATAITSVVSADARTLPSTTSEPSTQLSLLSAPSGAGLVRQGDDYRVRVTITNNGAVASDELTVSLHMSGSEVASRDELASWFAEESTEVPSGLSTVTTETLSPLAPGASAVLDLAVPRERPGMSGAFGSRAAIVTAADAQGTSVAADHTALVWVPTNVSVPAVDTTFVAALSTPGNRSTLLSVEEVAALTGDAGSLTRTLDAVAGRPVLVGIDPRVIASIRALGGSAPDDALAFLDRLERLPNETFMLPWADADPVATLAVEQVALPEPEGAGAGVSASTTAGVGTEQEPASPSPTATDHNDDAATDEEEGAAASAALLAELAQWTVSEPGWSWLGGEGLDSQALASLVDGGTSTLVIPSPALDGQPLVRTEGATLLGADDALARAAQRASLADSQQVHDSGLAQLSALLAASATGRSPFAIIELSREQLASTDRLVSTIAQTVMLPWADSALASSAAASTTRGGELVTTEIDDSRAAAISEALSAERADRRFADIAEPSWHITDERRLELLAALSLGWGEQSTIELERFVTDSAALRSSVQVVESSAILLLADRSSLPVTVQNDLDVPVRVYVHVDPETGRLRVLDGDVETLVEPRSQTRAVVPVESITNGDVVITVSVRDAAGRELGTPRRVELTLQAGWETLGVLIVGGATLVLLVVGIARDLRKRERRRQAERLEREPAGAEHPDAVSSGADRE